MAPTGNLRTSARRLSLLSSNSLRRVAALTLASALCSSPAHGQEIAFVAGCFPTPEAGDDAPLSSGDVECNDAAERASELEEAADLVALRRACDGAGRWETRANYAYALMQEGDWERATEVAEAVLDEVGAMWVETWLLFPMHHGDWVAARADHHPSASCMAGFRLEERADALGQANATMAAALRARAAARYRLAAEAGLPLAQERLKALDAYSSK